MDRITLTIESELFDDNTRQEASIRTNITVRQLVEEIRREFNLLDGDYSLTLKGSDKALDQNNTLEQLGIQTGIELIFERERVRLSQQIVARSSKPRPSLQAITSSVRASLREESTGKVFYIEWQPAIIGRADAGNPTGVERLAADLGQMAEARTVSRQHARITEQGGLYFLEALAERNPTFLNDRELVFGEKKPLQPGDQIRLGKIVLTFAAR